MAPVAKHPDVAADKIPEVPVEDELTLSVSGDVAAQIEMLSPEWRKILGQIAYYVAKVGLDLDEACILSDTTLERMEEVAERYPIVKLIIERKKLEHKKDLMKVVTARARAGDEKTALWLLERSYPEEFGKRKPGAGSKDADDMLAAAVAFVQHSGDANPLIKSTAGKAVIVKGSTDQAIKSLKEVLA